MGENYKIWYNEVYLNSEHWLNRSKDKKQSVGWTCEDCGLKTKFLQCHHTPQGYRHLGREMDWHLVALCGPCHRNRHLSWERIDSDLKNWLSEL